MKRQQKSKSGFKPPIKPNIGRPQDDALQTFFMKRLRNGKLQSIAAESQAQIQCYQYRDIKEKSKNNTLEDVYSEQKVAYVKNWFNNINSKKFKPLWQSFTEAAQKWQFKQIHGIQDFPEFLFCDQCDLCYVLHSYLTSQIKELKQKSQISNDELLYFQLLCFSTRDQISFRILKTIQKKFKEFLDKMTDVKSKVIVNYKQLNKQQKAAQIYEQSQREDLIPRQLRKGEIKNVLHKVEQIDIKGLQKTKQISKEQKGVKSRGRPKKAFSQLKQTQLLSQQQFDKVSQKLINHIIQSYAYIYPAQLRKKQESKQETAIQVDQQLLILDEI